jgi:hypothetical protein
MALEVVHVKVKIWTALQHANVALMINLARAR